MRCRRAVVIVELVIAMAVLAALAAVGTVSYAAYTRRAHTTAAAETLSQIGLLLEAYRSLSPGGAYPTDAVNAAGQPNSGAPSYDALAADLAPLEHTAFPPYASVFASWAYQPEAPAGPPSASYTVAATAVNGDEHVLCLDGVNGVTDLGPGGTPASPGVSCR